MVAGGAWWGAGLGARIWAATRSPASWRRLPRRRGPMLTAPLGFACAARALFADGS